jgi:hypothetical protein
MDLTDTTEPFKGEDSNVTKLVTSDVTTAMRRFHPIRKT